MHELGLPLAGIICKENLGCIMQLCPLFLIRRIKKKPLTLTRLVILHVYTQIDNLVYNLIYAYAMPGF